MKIEKITTLGELKKAGYQSKSIKDELRDNLIKKLSKKENKINQFIDILPISRRLFLGP